MIISGKNNKNCWREILCFFIMLASFPTLTSCKTSGLEGIPQAHVSMALNEWHYVSDKSLLSYEVATDQSVSVIRSFPRSDPLVILSMDEVSTPRYCSFLGVDRLYKVFVLDYGIFDYYGNCMLVDDEKYIFLSTDEDVIDLLSSRVKNLESLNFEELTLFAEMFGVMRGYSLFDISDVPPGAYTPPTATFEIHKREKEWDISCTYSFLGLQSLYSFSFSAEQGLQFSKKELVQYYFTY